MTEPSINRPVRHHHRLSQVTRRALVLVVVLLAACSALNPSATIVGEITDTDIEVNITSAPWSVWVEFMNVGSSPCPLIEIVTEVPADALPLNPDGTVKLEGTAVLGPGSYSDSGDTIAPGGTFRFHESPLDAPGGTPHFPVQRPR